MSRGVSFASPHKDFTLDSICDLEFQNLLKYKPLNSKAVLIQKINGKGNLPDQGLQENSKLSCRTLFFIQ